MEYDFQNNKKRKIYDCLLKKTQPYISKYIAVSKDMYEYLMNYNIDPNKIHLIYHGVEFKNIDKSSKKIELDKESINLLSVGRLEKVKNFETLIKAIAILKANYSKKIKCYIVGEGSQLEKLKQLINILNLEENIELTGFLNNPFDCLELSDVHLYVQSSIYESFGLTIIEAIIHDLIVVGYNIGGISEILSDNCGYLYNNNTPDDLANTIVKALDNKDFNDEIKINSKNKVKKLFNIDKTIRKTIYLYK